MTRPSLRLTLGVAALATVVLLYVGHLAWPQATLGIGAAIANAFERLRGLGWPGFLLMQVLIAISGFLPASLVGVSAGAAYGATIGFATAAISTLTGAAVAFLLSRSLLRPFIERKLHSRPHLASLDGDIGNRGWRLVCLMRLSPVMPFAATSYALGLSSVPLGEYLLGSLASLPSLLAYVLAGVLVKTGVSAWSEGATAIRLASLGIGLASMAILAIQGTRMLRRILAVPNATAGAREAITASLGTTRRPATVMLRDGVPSRTFRDDRKAIADDEQSRSMTAGGIGVRSAVVRPPQPLTAGSKSPVGRAVHTRALRYLRHRCSASRWEPMPGIHAHTPQPATQQRLPS